MKKALNLFDLKGCLPYVGANLYDSPQRAFVGAINVKIQSILMFANRSRRDLLKSRRGDRVKRKNSIVLPLAVSFAYFFSVKEIGIIDTDKSKIER